MSFPQQTPHIYDRAHVNVLEPNQMGVYGLFLYGRCIYVGKGYIRKRLLDHLNYDNACITREQPAFWVAEVSANTDARERQLILELNPVCNQRVE